MGGKHSVPWIPHPLTGSFFLWHSFFFCHPFWSLALCLSLKKLYFYFFDGGVKHNSVSESIHDPVQRCSLGCKQSYTTAGLGVATDTPVNSYSHVLISEMTTTLGSTLHGNVVCVATVAIWCDKSFAEQKDKEAKLGKQPGPHCLGLLNSPVLFFISDEGQFLRSLRGSAGGNRAIMRERTLLKVLEWHIFTQIRSQIMIVRVWRFSSN